MSLDPRIRTAFWASLCWAIVGIIAIFTSVVIAFIDTSHPTKPWIVGIASLWGIFCLIQSYRTIKLFFPGAFLISAGVGLIYLSPIIQNVFWTIALKLVEVVTGRESGLATNFVRPILKTIELFGQFGKVSEADLFCGTIGILLCFLGAWIGRDAQVLANVSKASEITDRIKRD